MSDERTDDQRKADDELREAVAAVAHAYADGDESSGWVLTEYLVIYAQQGWDDDGDSCTAVGVAVDNNSSPIHRMLGLAEYASTQYRKMLTED